MYKKFLFAIVLNLSVAGLASSASAFTNPSVSDIAARVSASSYENIIAPSTGTLIYTRAGDDRGFEWYGSGLRRATANHDAARDNIVAWHQDLGLTTTTQSLGVHTTDDNTVTFHGGMNVHAVQPGTNPNAGYIILGAHYDTAGPANVPGADDNGTGTAGVMEAARVLSRYTFESTIIYAHFDLEERFDQIPRVVGTGNGNVGIGSGKWVNENITNDPSDTSKIYYQDVHAMINLDMIGLNSGSNAFGMLKPSTSMSNSDPLIVGLTNAYSNYTDLAAPTLATNGLSDHKSFYNLADIPSIAMFERITSSGSPSYNPYYHTSNDYERDGYLDYEYATEIVTGAVGYIAETAVISGLTEPIDGDTNLDVDVDINDLITLAANYGSAGGWPEGDFTGEGQVNINDLILLAANYGYGVPAPIIENIPEPATMLIMAVGAIGIIRKRRSA